MKALLRSILLVLPCFLAGCLLAQNPIQSNSYPQDSRAILTQAISAAGGTANLRALQDFEGIGTVTYYWGGEEVKGDVKILSRGAGQLRLEASLPEGVRTLVVSNGRGSLREHERTKKSVSSTNSDSLTGLSSPLMHVLASLNDASSKVSYEGLTIRKGVRLHHIRVERAFPFDPDGTLRRMTQREFYVDATTFYVVGAVAMVKDESQGGTLVLPREVWFSDFRSVSGVVLPFQFTEVVAGQNVSSIQLTNININTGLRDADFE